MKNKNIINLANPADHQNAVTKKYVNEKTETIYLTFFCQNMPPEVSSLRHSSRKKWCADITQTTTQTLKYFIKKTVVSLLWINLCSTQPISNCEPSINHVGCVIKSFTLIISYIDNSQSSKEQRVRMKMFVRSLLKSSKNIKEVKNSTLPRRWPSQMKIGVSSTMHYTAGFAGVYLMMTLMQLSQRQQN